MEREILRLLKAGCVQSALWLCDMYSGAEVTSSQCHSQSSQQRQKVTVDPMIFGDVLLEAKEYRRAIEKYEKVLLEEGYSSSIAPTPYASFSSSSSSSKIAPARFGVGNTSRSEFFQREIEMKGESGCLSARDSTRLSLIIPESAQEDDAHANLTRSAIMHAPPCESDELSWYTRSMQARAKIARTLHVLGDTSAAKAVYEAIARASAYAAATAATAAAASAGTGAHSAQLRSISALMSAPIEAVLAAIPSRKSSLNTSPFPSPEEATVLPPLSALLQLASIYESEGVSTSAKAVYQHVLQRCPLALEAALALVRLGEPVESVLTGGGPLMQSLALPLPLANPDNSKGAESASSTSTSSTSAGSSLLFSPSHAADAPLSDENATPPPRMRAIPRGRGVISSSSSSSSSSSFSSSSSVVAPPSPHRRVSATKAGARTTVSAAGDREAKSRKSLPNSTPSSGQCHSHSHSHSSSGSSSGTTDDEGNNTGECATVKVNVGAHAAALIQVHGLVATAKYAEALSSLSQQLLSQSPLSVRLRLLKARILMQIADSDVACATLLDVARTDPFSTEALDRLVWLLRKRGKISQVNALAHKLMSSSPARPEAWVASAVFAEQSGDKMKALACLDRADSLASTFVHSANRASSHVCSYLIRAWIHVGAGEHDVATKWFNSAMQASGAEVDIAAHVGLCEAYLGQKQFHPALKCAKEAFRVAPKSPKALTLIGLVLAGSNTPEGRDKAKTAFSKALGIDPKCTEAAIHLSRLQWGDGAHAAAVQLIEQVLMRTHSDFLHTHAATMYAALGDQSKAIAHFEAALRLTPGFPQAVQGLEELTADQDAEDDEDGEGVGEYEQGDNRTEEEQMVSYHQHQRQYDHDAAAIAHADAEAARAAAAAVAAATGTSRTPARGRQASRGEDGDVDVDGRRSQPRSRSASSRRAGEMSMQEADRMY